jgi:uncharacterized protein YndB with AHSA1/START domain
VKQWFAPAPWLPPANVTGDVPLFTAVILLEPHGSSIKYTAIVIHGDEAGAKKHAATGFHDGWGKALDQLVSLAKENVSTVGRKAKRLVKN